MSVSALDRSLKTSAMLVDFVFGATPTIRRYCDWTAPITWLGARYEPVPEMEVELPAVTGGLKESPLGITLPLDEFTHAISIGEAHARITVVVREYVFADQDSWVEVHFSGQIERAIRNYKGLPRSVRLDCINRKQMFEVPLGITADPDCKWTFGDLSNSPCGYALSADVELRKVVQISGTSLTVTGLNEAKQWTRGYVEFDGLRIGIRTRVGQTFGLRQQAPRRWAEQTIRCVPGCRKTITDCRTYNRESQFMGIGFAIPAFHPIIETP